MSTKHDNKVREMQGVKPGRGSAGRANAAKKERRGQVINLAEIDRACNAFLKARVPGYKVASFGGFFKAGMTARNG